MKLKKKKEKKIMNEVLEKIQKIGIVPVVVLNDAKDAEPLAKALCNGGLPCAEVTSVQMQQRSQSVSCLRNIQRCLLEPEQF